MKSLKALPSDRHLTRLHDSLVRPADRAVLLADLRGSLESRDRYTLLNENGIARLRVFERYTLYLSRARQRGGHPIPLLRGAAAGRRVASMAVQLAGCNWRCWYCYVDYKLLSASPRYGRWTTVRELADLLVAMPEAVDALDLTGGEPDLVPEWALWVLEELDDRGLRGRFAVWQDTNLSTTLIWEQLSPAEIAFVAGYPRHSRVGCFKGYDEESFSFNTAMPGELFAQQFEVMGRLIASGFDMYAYATLTGPVGHGTSARMSRFVDRLQKIHPKLPLRTIPLRIAPFTAMRTRRGAAERAENLVDQISVGELWDDQLRSRFSAQELATPYELVSLDSPPNVAAKRIARQR